MSEFSEAAPPPLLERRKTIGWILLAASVGATLLFAVLCVLKGPPKWGREGGFYAWPVATVLISIFSAISLKRSYRAEPGNFAGFWHLSIVDFYAVTLFTALSMGLFRAVWPASFISVGIAVSLVLGFTYLFCLLLATRKGYDRGAAKYGCALSFLLMGFGWMTVGSVGIIFVVFLMMRDLHGFINTMQAILSPRLDDKLLADGILVGIRAGLFGLPIGIVLSRRIGPPASKSASEL